MATDTQPNRTDLTQVCECGRAIERPDLHNACMRCVIGDEPQRVELESYSIKAPMRERDFERDWAPRLHEVEGMIKEDIAAGHDSGSCVLGAGLAVDVIPPRCRYSQRRIIFHAPFQGNVGSYRALRRAGLFLRAAGLDVYWYDGIMD